HLVFLLTARPPPQSPLFPYTTLFRSNHIRGVTVTCIDREKKCVEDSRGIKTPYDVLILGTGSRPTMPKDIPTMPGIFSMRRRSEDRKSTRLNSSHVKISYAVFCLKKK